MYILILIQLFFPISLRLKSEIEELDKEENNLDQQIEFMQMNKKILLEDEENSKYAYLSYDDLIKATESSQPTQSLIIKTTDPSALSIEVPEAMYIYNNSAVKQKYQISIKSDSVPIEVYFLNKKIKKDPMNELVNDVDPPSEKANKDDDEAKDIFSDDELILLEPTPSFKDFAFNMDKNDGVLDLLDIDINQESKTNQN
jgi:hypothetical protein